ncbi:hypothetical protein BDP27DRAFT_206497 [Rhodocollybia butyracea]|uniref:Uncharacterized protein n=1 Tax=Rhodocollybia butyracea TaxID=206335 RepID=A0A9P5PJW3_9AGAR|nr:hypothetical protein BDP27DRAFT_206497 [Rhodocollybia butyracea]
MRRLGRWRYRSDVHTGSYAGFRNLRICTILSLQILDEYILRVKTRSIELPPTRITKPTSEFTSTSGQTTTFVMWSSRMSNVEIQNVDMDMKKNIVEMLASDVIQGLFFCCRC